jgi:hypothetical protein
VDTGGGGGVSRGAGLQYLFGAIGGADARGSGAMGLFEFGIRFTRYSALFQVGDANDGGFFGVLARWNVLSSSLSPYIGIGLVGNKDGDSRRGRPAGSREERCRVARRDRDDRRLHCAPG